MIEVISQELITPGRRKWKKCKNHKDGFYYDDGRTVIEVDMNDRSIREVLSYHEQAPKEPVDTTLSIEAIVGLDQFGVGRGFFHKGKFVWGYGRHNSVRTARGLRKELKRYFTVEAPDYEGHIGSYQNFIDLMESKELPRTFRNSISELVKLGVN